MKFTSKLATSIKKLNKNLVYDITDHLQAYRELLFDSHFNEAPFNETQQNNWYSELSFKWLSRLTTFIFPGNSQILSAMRSSL